MVPYCSIASDKITYKDRSGRVVATATIQGNKTTYQDRSGRIQYYVTTSGNKSTYKDISGRIIGSSNSSAIVAKNKKK